MVDDIPTPDMFRAGAGTETVDRRYREETLELLTAYRSIANDKVRLALKQFVELVASEARTDDRTT